MSHLINKVLSKTIGFNLTRAKTRRVDKIKGNPLYVEFVGVPGVGKTTLYKNVFKEIKRKWRDIHELKTIFIKHAEDQNAESLLCYQELAQHKMQSIETRNYSGIDQMKLVKYFHSVLIADSFGYLFNNDYNVMSEEGLIHNFGDSLLALFKGNKEEFENLMKHRAVVYCHAPAEIVAKQILEREKKTGRLLPQHKVSSFDELVNLQNESLKLKQQLIDFLSKHDIPILSIDTSDPMTGNVAQVKHFLTELTHNK